MMISFSKLVHRLKTPDFRKVTILKKEKFRGCKIQMGIFAYNVFNSSLDQKHTFKQETNSGMSS